MLRIEDIPLEEYRILSCDSVDHMNCTKSNEVFDSDPDILTVANSVEWAIEHHKKYHQGD